MWHLEPNADIQGTSLVDEIDLVPAFLLEEFGEPTPGDGYRVTGRYVFADDNGGVFTIYDWKSTAAFLDEDDALPPGDFWRSDVEQEFSIGGRGDYGDGSAVNFAGWLHALQARWLSERL